MNKLLLIALLCISSLQATTVTLKSDNKLIDYNQDIIVEFSDMPENQNDWVGIFKKGDAYTFANIVSYKVTNGIKEGEFNFGKMIMPFGDYEVHAFASGSWSPLASDAFLFGRFDAPKPHVDVAGGYKHTNHEDILVSFAGMSENPHDWVGIYPDSDTPPEHAKHDFTTLVAYQFTSGLNNGVLNFGKLAPGSYWVHAFHANSWETQSWDLLIVNGEEVMTTISSGGVYETGERIYISYRDTPGNAHDWIAVFAEGAANTFANIQAYQFTNGKIDGGFLIDSLPAGRYEARAFAANSWQPLASAPLLVEGADAPPVMDVRDAVHKTGNRVNVAFRNMPRNEHDWIAIFPADSPSTFANIVKYRYLEGAESNMDFYRGSFSVGPVEVAGEYEMRIFYANSWRAQVSKRFTVVD